MAAFIPYKLRAHRKAYRKVFGKLYLAKAPTTLATVLRLHRMHPKETLAQILVRAKKLIPATPLEVERYNTAELKLAAYTQEQEREQAKRRARNAEVNARLAMERFQRSLKDKDLAPAVRSFLRSTISQVLQVEQHTSHSEVRPVAKP